MAIRVNCPVCEHVLKARDEMMGRRVRCPSCKNTFTITLGFGGTPTASMSRKEAKNKMEDAISAQQIAQTTGVPGPRADDMVAVTDYDIASHGKPSRDEVAMRVGGYDILPGRDFARYGLTVSVTSAGFVLVLWAIWALGTAGFTPMGVGTWIAYAFAVVLIILGINFFASEHITPPLILGVFSIFPIVYLLALPIKVQEVVLEYVDYPLLATAALGALLSLVGFLQRLIARGRFGPLLPAVASIVIAVAGPGLRYSAHATELVGIGYEFIPPNDVLTMQLKYKKAFWVIHEGLMDYAEARSGYFPVDLQKLVDVGILKQKDINDPFQPLGGAPARPEAVGGYRYIRGQGPIMGRFMNVVLYTHETIPGEDVAGKDRIYVLYLGGTVAALDREDFKGQLRDTIEYIEEGERRRDITGT